MDDDIVKECSALLANVDGISDYALALERLSLSDALQNNTSNPGSKQGDAIWERTPEISASEGPAYGTIPEKQAAKTTDKFSQLAGLDYSTERKYKLVEKSLSKLCLPEDFNEQAALQTVSDFVKDLEKDAATARAIVCMTPDDKALKVAFLKRCNSLEREMTQIYAVLEQRTSPRIFREAASPRSFDNTAPDNGLDQKDPLMLLAAFIILVLNVFGSLIREWANSALQLQLSLLQAAFTRLRPAGPSRYHQTMLDSFPRDIRTARKLFQLDPETITYAACPRCSSLYLSSPEVELPVHCNARRFPNSPECGEIVSKLGSGNDKGRHVRRVPKRPFVIQDFDHFKASLLNRPGMESLLDRGTQFNNSEDLWDIKDGTTIRELKGPDGKPFFDGLRRKELRLAWALSIDWFNPFLNKIAGRSASTGSIVMTCLNLPPSLRYQPENMYIVGIIPGPREPSVDDFDHFLTPVVDFLDRSWRQGTRFSRTESAPLGRMERSILAVVVADLPGARKITGTASHSSTSSFCSLCRLPKDAINNFDVDRWPKVSAVFQREIAIKWRDAPNNAARKRIFKQHGIRWSSLWKLDYFDPSKMVVVDAMHNLFLGLVQFHIRDVIGITTPRSDEEPIPTRDSSE